MRKSQGGKGETPVLRSTGGVQAEYSGVQRSTAEYEWGTSGVQGSTIGVREVRWSTGVPPFPPWEISKCNGLLPICHLLVSSLGRGGGAVFTRIFQHSFQFVFHKMRLEIDKSVRFCGFCSIVRLQSIRDKKN